MAHNITDKTAKRQRWTRDGEDWTRGMYRLIEQTGGGWGVFVGDSYHAILDTLEQAKAWTRGEN